MDPNTFFYLGTERTAMNSLVPFLPVPQGRRGLRHALPRKIVHEKRLSFLLRQKILGNIKILGIRLGYFQPQEEDLFVTGQIVEERR